MHTSPQLQHSPSRNFLHRRNDGREQANHSSRVLTPCAVTPHAVRRGLSRRGFDFQHKHESSAKACCETQTDLFVSFKLNVDETVFYPGADIISVYKTGREY